MKELNRFRQFLAEGRISEKEGDAMAVPFTGQTSFPKDENIAKAVVAQLQSGNPDAPIIKAMGKYGDANKAKAWVKKIGPDTIEKRILDIASKIPSQGLAKKDMPFLPGPPDASGKASDVEDALNPGGKYNIDFKEAIEPPAKNTIEPGSKEAEDYMTSGKKDGKASDDDVTVKIPASVEASNAKPTQTNILLAKGLSMAIGGVEGGDIGAWIGTDGRILDGHHRWAATMLNNPSAKLGAAGAIDMDGMGDQTTALKHLTAIGNALGNKTKLKENEDDGYDKASRELFDMTWDEVRRENDPRMRQAVHDEVQKDHDLDYIDDVQESQSISQGFYEVDFIEMDGNEVTRDFRHFTDENEAKQMFNDLKGNPEIVRVTRNELFKGDGKNYLGGSEEREYFVNKEPDMHRIFLNSRLGDKRFEEAESIMQFIKRKTIARKEFLQNEPINEMKPGDAKDIAQKRFDRLSKDDQTKLLQIAKMVFKEKANAKDIEEQNLSLEEIYKDITEVDKEEEKIRKEYDGMKRPSQDEVNDAFEKFERETHYLNNKPVGEWDAADMSNWKSILRKGGRISELEIRGYDDYKTQSPSESDCISYGYLDADITFNIDGKVNSDKINGAQLKSFAKDIDQFLDAYFKKTKQDLEAVSPLNTKDESYQDWVDNGDGTFNVGSLAWKITGDFEDVIASDSGEDTIEQIMPSINQLKSIAAKYKMIDQDKIWVEDYNSEISNSCED